MDEREELRLYALALSLVPDQDAAGDLFMAARNEADLRRRAARWLEGQGVAHQEGPVPALDEEQRRYGLHLARRRGARRRLRWGLAAAGACLAALALALAPLLTPGASLADEPAFNGEPVAAEMVGDGIRLAVYRARAEMGVVNLFWSLQGPGVGQGARFWQLQLKAEEGGWHPAVETEMLQVDPTRLLGRSRFAIAALPGRAYLRMESREAGRALSDWIVPVPVVRAAPAHSQARRIPVEKLILSDRYQMRLHHLEVAPTFTLVRYSGDPTAYRDPVRIEVGHQELKQVAFWTAEQDQSQATAVFEPVPPGAASLLVYFPARGISREVTVFPVTSAALSRWQQNDATGSLFFEFTLPAGTRYAEVPFLTDEAGRRHSLLPHYEWVEEKQTRYLFSATYDPGPVRFLTMTIELVKPVPMAPTEVKLGR